MSSVVTPIIFLQDGLRTGLDLALGSDDNRTMPVTDSLLRWRMRPRWRTVLFAIRRVALAGLVSAAACASSNEQGEPPEPSGRAQAALVQTCAQACYQRDQNRAVQADIIRRQCELACRSQLTWPLVSDRDDVDEHMGAYVRLQGLLTEKNGEPALQLSDGVVVMLRVSPDTAGDLPFQGLVAASGRLEADRSLTTHNIVELR